MKKKPLLIFLLLIFCAVKSNGQAFLTNPIEGIYGTDFTIVNYVDWSFDSILDHHCGSKTYDGHQGTDFVLKSFKQMDSGVYVLAAANGRVTFAVDTFFDREKESIISKSLGNYICIKHPNKYYTYYAHLKKNSLLVQEGDSVVAGQRIAQVASSGNSSDPHLHMEVWYDSSFVVDPYKGPCGNGNTLWLNPYNYDSSFHIWEYGMHNKVVDINLLREREISVTAPYNFDLKNDTIYTFWSHLSGLRKGDTLSIEWLNPKGELHFTYSFPIQRDWWYYYFWSHIDSIGITAGRWTVVLNKNNKEIIKQNFTVSDPLSLYDIKDNSACHWNTIFPSKQTPLQNLSGKLKLFDSKGSDLSHWLSQYHLLEDLPPGIYFIQYSENGLSCYSKIKL